MAQSTLRNPGEGGGSFFCRHLTCSLATPFASTKTCTRHELTIAHECAASCCFCIQQSMSKKPVSACKCGYTSSRTDTFKRHLKTCRVHHHDEFTEALESLEVLERLSELEEVMPDTTANVDVEPPTQPSSTPEALLSKPKLRRCFTIPSNEESKNTHFSRPLPKRCSFLESTAENTESTVESEEPVKKKRKLKRLTLCSPRTQYKRLQDILRYTREVTQENPEEVLKFLLTRHFPNGPAPFTLEETVRLCHEYEINCHNYEKNARLLHLPYKWHEVNKLMKSMQAKSPLGVPQPIAGLDGHQYDFYKYLTFYLEKRGCVEDEAIDIKISCDG